MLKMEGYLNVIEEGFDRVAITEELHDNITAVYFRGDADVCLDSEFGVGIDIEITDMKSWMANYRSCEFWCSPEFGSQPENVPDETQGFIYEKTDGSFGVILPVVSEKYKCVLCGNENGKLTAKLFSWYDKLTYCHGLAFLYAEGKNPFEMMADCARLGLKLLNNGCRTRAERRYPEMFEYLGWCSWDAFQIRVTEGDLITKCQEFADKNIPVKWAIIDDMWGEVRDFYEAPYDTPQGMSKVMHTSKLYSFKADPRRFPNGLKNCIDNINKFGIKVGMWHPTTGYWMGIDPDGEIYKDYKDCLIQAESGHYLHSYEQDKAYRFYNAFHDYLRECGTEFIKIDNQSMTNRFYRGLAPVGEVARNFHNAMEASVGQHFDNQMINCMGTASEDMWNRAVSPISRCSGDFKPENKEWFTKHIMQCSYNCLVQGQFYYCDWDMWWTDDGQAMKNSIIRAVSGGPIYVSDTSDRSRREILMPLVFEDGKILRCDRPGMPTADCITSDPRTNGKIFKIQNKCDEHGVIAVFNVDENDNAVSGVISPWDVDGFDADEAAVYDHFTKEVRILKRGENFALTLDSIDDFKLYIVASVKNGFAAIGRTDKFISPKSIKFIDGEKVYLVEDGPAAYIKNGKLIEF